MPEFRVIYEAVSGHAMRLDAIPGEIENAHSALPGHAGAAAGTSAAAGVADFVGHVAAVLPAFAEASSRLQLAMIAAAAAYGDAERSIEDSAR